MNLTELQAELGLNDADFSDYISKKLSIPKVRARFYMGIESGKFDGDTGTSEEFSAQKHGSHDQRAHGRRGSTRHNSEEVAWQEHVEGSKLPTANTGTVAKGKPVSEAFNVKKSILTSFQEQRVADAIATIDSVHGDGELPNVLVGINGERSRSGVFIFDEKAQKFEIGISSLSTHPELVFAHETGHLLDSKGLGEGGKPASKSGSPEMKEWATAVNSSAAITHLNEMKKFPYQYEKEVTQKDGTIVSVRPDKAYLVYATSDVEVFARSYAQYIAVRSGNQEMLKAVRDSRMSTLYPGLQWEDSDFEPIATAFDNLMKAKGWIE